MYSALLTLGVAFLAMPEKPAKENVLVFTSLPGMKDLAGAVVPTCCQGLGGIWGRLGSFRQAGGCAYWGCLQSWLSMCSRFDFGSHRQSSHESAYVACL